MLLAIAYSPTEPNPSHLADVYRPTPAHQAPAMHTPVFVSVPEDSASAASQQFQAPFIPSINLENTQSTHNGWSIVTPPSVVASAAPVVSASAQIESKGNRISASLINANATAPAPAPNASAATSISRSDSAESIESSSSVERTTKKFDFDNFKPEFQSGFMPIYKNSIAPANVVVGPPAASPPAAVIATTATATPVSSAPISSEHSETVKTKSEQTAEEKSDHSDTFSLESLFYGGDDEDDGDNDNDDEITDDE